MLLNKPQTRRWKTVRVTRCMRKEMQGDEYFAIEKKTVGVIRGA